MSLTKRYFYGLAAVLVLSLIGIGVTQTRIEDLTEITADGIAEDDDQIFFGLDKVDAGVSRKLSLAELKKTGVQVLNVKQYGAVGDGVANDTFAIATAVTALADNQALYFPPGIYLTDTNVTIPSGTTGTKILGYGARLAATSGTTIVLILSDDTTVEGLHVDGNGIATYGIYIGDGVSGCQLRYCRVGNTAGATAVGIGVEGDGADNTTIEHCYIYDVVGASVGRGIRLSGNTTPTTPVRGVKILNNVITNVEPVADADGIVVQDWTAVCDVLISGNTITECDKRAIKIQSPGVTIGHNKIVIPGTTAYGAIDVQVGNCEIIANTIYGAADAMISMGSSLGDDANICANNKITIPASHGASSVDAIVTEGTSVSNVSITGNIITAGSAIRSFVSCEGEGAGMLISNNTFDGPVSGGSVAIYTGYNSPASSTDDVTISNNRFANVAGEYLLSDLAQSTTGVRWLGNTSDGDDLGITASATIQVYYDDIDETGNRTIASGTLTDTKPLTISQTWNDGADTFEGVKVKVTDTASAAASLPFQVLGGAAGATQLMKLNKSGVMELASTDVELSTGADSFYGGNQFQVSNTAGAQAILRLQGTDRYAILGPSGQVTGGGRMTSLQFQGVDNPELRFSNTNGLTTYGVIVGQEANHLALRNSTAAQNLSVYNTYTSGSVYERGRFGWNGSNVLEIGTEHVGGAARSVSLIAGGANVATLNSNGGFYVASFMYSPDYRFGAGHYVRASSPSDGVLTLKDEDDNGFNRLQLGGTTSSFPSIARASAGLSARLADDSATTYVLQKHLVEANTAGSGSPNILTEAESNTTLTNEGATAANYHTLPTAVAGQVFRFRVQDADGLRVTANSGDTIRIGGNVTAAAGYVQSVTIGDTIELEAINATEWIATALGTWTDGTFTTNIGDDRHPIGMVTESTDQTTVTVTGKSAILFSNPNPTTVTTFTTADGIGHMLHVTASNGNTTIDNGTTIKCAGAADLVLGSNDGATFVWNGSAWIQTGYSDN